jgi:alkylhydroperoxidase/carboxymuconolactone decarboxylase family protein YurZ
MATESTQPKVSANQQPVSPWVAALEKLREWDPAWAESAVKITTNPWTDGALPKRFVELVCVGLNASRAGLNPDGTRRHIRAALAEGATRKEILFVLKCAAVMRAPLNMSRLADAS